MSDFLDFDTRAEAAMLAAAVGDALGWPQENRGGRIGGKRDVEPRLEFVEWRRRGGGRFANHEEVIGAGEYSDDTQLIAAVSRSLLAGSDWWSRWTRSELPFWLLYERGGGGATKRAAQAWTKGTPPWTGETRDRYFSAGGNGVAMRVLPHLLRRDGGFAEAAQAIVADGIATHGHPRALVGAQAYAFALWSALRRQQRLAYGALLEEVRNGVDVWSVRPSVDDVAPDWARAAKTAMEGAYDDIWEATVGEMTDLLDACLEGIGQGALSIDRETLAKLGTFDKRVSSAGTVTAAGAIFLASRYASRPAQGLVAAAFAEGADTDTLGSMTGGLLAAISGGDWLGGARELLQDDRYVARLARALVAGPQEGDSTRSAPDQARSFHGSLETTEVGGEMALPDGRSGRLRNLVDHPTKTRNRIRTFVVECEDGQTLFVKRITRLSNRAESATEAHASPAAAEGARRRQRMVIAMEVRDLDESIAFWRDVANLEVKRSERYADVSGFLALFPAEQRGSVGRTQLDMEYEPRLTPPRQRIVVFVEGQEINAIKERLGKTALPVAPLLTNGDRPVGICCADPDGNLVEFRESNGIG